MRQEIVIATLMRRDSRNGVQTHVTHVASLLDAVLPRSGAVVTPFSSRSPVLPCVFAVRLLVAPFSGSAGVWWYRHWHGRYLTVALGRRLRQAAPDATVYAQCPVSAAAALRSRRAGQRVVMAAHFNVSQADEWVGKGLIPLDGRLYRSIRRFEAETLPRLDGVVYVSAYLRRVLEERVPALRGVPSVVIPNFLLPADASGRADAGENAPGPSGDIITVGSLEPRKNHAYLLEVLRAASDRGYRYRLTLVGDGPSRRPLEKAARRLGVADQVSFLGHRANARALMAAHRLYCHTALVENLPFAIVEAMSEGLPVLAAPVGGVPEMLRPGVDGDFWPLDDPDGAADVLIKILEDERRRVSMGDSARQEAGRRWSADRAGRRLLRFLVGDGRELPAPVCDR